MRVSLKPFIPDDKNAEINSGLFVGSVIQNFGIGKYVVQILLLGMAIPSKVVGTYEEAEKLQENIWKAMKKGDKL